MSSDERTPARRGLGCLIMAMGALAVLGLFGVMLATMTGGSSGTGPRVVEIVEESPEGARRKLAIVEIEGALVDDGRHRRATEVVEMLDHARKDEAVAGVLLRIDTPGGSVTDSDLIHRAVGRLREAEKPVVVLMGDLCASGGYYVAAAADVIYALPTTVTGSIGVIIFGLNAYELLQRIGVQDVSIMSGNFKDLLSPTKPMDEEERRLLQAIVDAMHARFVDLVARGRNLKPDDVRAFADGRLFTADQAKARRLVDEVGYEEDALGKLRDLTKGGPFQVVRYRRDPSLLEVLGALRAPPATPGSALLGRLGDGPRVMYLYSPLGLR